MRKKEGEKEGAVECKQEIPTYLYECLTYHLFVQHNTFLNARFFKALAYLRGRKRKMYLAFFNRH